MEPSVEIRELTAADIEHVALLFADDMRTLGYDTPMPKIKALLQQVVEDRRTTSACWIARTPDSRTPFGAILVNFYLSIKFGGPSLWIEGLYVSPDFRRRGVGQQLVDHVIDWGVANDYLGVDLEAYQTNTPAAVLYRSLGFRRLGRARFSLDFADLA